MKEFKFFANNTNYLEEEETISQYDDYDMVVLDRIRYGTNPIAQVHRFDMNGGSKAIIIRDIIHTNNFPLAETVTIEYELYHIEPNQPNRMDTRTISMRGDEYIEIRYERV